MTLVLWASQLSITSSAGKLYSFFLGKWYSWCPKFDNLIGWILECHSIRQWSWNQFSSIVTPMLMEQCYNSSVILWTIGFSVLYLPWLEKRQSMWAYPSPVSLTWVWKMWVYHTLLHLEAAHLPTWGGRRKSTSEGGEKTSICKHLHTCTHYGRNLDDVHVHTTQKCQAHCI